MKKVSADYIFPISQPPVKNGILLIDNNKVIIDVLNPAELDYSVEDVEMHEGIICPGFVNAHCHLELSYMKNKIPQHTGLIDFILNVEKIKKGEELEIIKAIKDADREMKRNGIIAAGDISNTNISFATKNESQINYHTFIEVYGSDTNKSSAFFQKGFDLYLYNQLLLTQNHSNVSIVPHALYSVSQELFAEIAAFNNKINNILCIHHQESNKEYSFPFNKTQINNLPSVLKYLSPDNHLQLVHNTFSTNEDIDFAENHFKNLWWCFCPNANLHIENSLPNINLFVQKNVSITIGTDSLASNNKLSVLDELTTISTYFPEIPLHELLKWATLNGAQFLKMSKFYGSIEKGKLPGINLIKLNNINALRLTKESSVKVLM